MIQLILLSGLLLTLGSALYFLLIQRWLSAVYAKWWIVGLLLLSISIPAAFLQFAPANQTQAIDYHSYNAWNQVDINDSELQACYKEAANSKEFCRCEVVQKAKIVLYKPSPWYDFLLKCQKVAWWVLSIVLAVWLLDSLMKWAYLWQLARRSPKVRYEINGTVFYLLYPSHRYFPLSSFSLWRHYIIWSPILESLNEEERKLVFLHELGHLRQRDTWVQLLWRGLGVWWWMMPAYYWLHRELNKLNEFVADEFALQHPNTNAKEYARLLIRAKEQQMQQAPLPAFAFSLAKSLLKKRVLHILNNQEQTKQNNPRQPRRWAAYLLYTALGFWALCHWLQPQIARESENLQEYELVQQKHQETNQTVFCKDCLK